MDLLLRSFDTTNSNVIFGIRFLRLSFPFFGVAGPVIGNIHAADSGLAVETSDSDAAMSMQDLLRHQTLILRVQDRDELFRVLVIPSFGLRV